MGGVCIKLPDAGLSYCVFLHLVLVSFQINDEICFKVIHHNVSTSFICISDM